ncbi:MAG TPA: FHA domain-containing protein [Xanthobacteraceae bacterium]|nr:FHA domain-containing protein [Xanthobacteraceae bacterium]
MIRFPILLDIYQRGEGPLKRVERISLPEVGDYAIGRTDDNQIMLDAPEVSRRHAMLVVREDGMAVADRGSTNRTYIGDAEVDQEKWDGALPIRIAQFEIHLVQSSVLEKPKPAADPGSTRVVEQAGAATTAAPAPKPAKRDESIEFAIGGKSDSKELRFPRNIFTSEMVNAQEIKSSEYFAGEVMYISVGAGLGSFVWADHLRIFGVGAGSIRAIGDDVIPYANYQRLCRNSQIPPHERLRSNSQSTPDNIWGFPGYASRETWRDVTSFRFGGFKHIFQVFGEASLAQTYTPRSGDVFKSIDREAQRINWREIFTAGRVLGIRKTNDERYAVAYRVPEDQARGGSRERIMIGKFLHISTGYPATRFTEDLQAFKARYPEESRVFNAYENHEVVYRALVSDQRPVGVVVRGRGIVASRIIQRLFECRDKNKNITIIHQMRNPVGRNEGLKYGRTRRYTYNNIENQGFNWPKSTWGGQHLRETERASPEERSKIYDAIGGTTTADRRDWRNIIQLGLGDGWYKPVFGHFETLELVKTDQGTKIQMKLKGAKGAPPTEVLADYVVDCTGLIGDVTHSPCLKDLLETYKLPRNEIFGGPKPAYGGIFVTPDFEIPGMRNGTGRTYAAGQITARGPMPGVDTFLGMQYSALRSVDHMATLGAPEISLFGPLRSFGQWMRWCTGRAP